jgi:transglutaminase-like putative cysteine protease
MRYRIRHLSTYGYEDTVSVCHNEVRLVPRDSTRQRVLGATLAIDPAPDALRLELDYFGNPTNFFTLDEPHFRMSLCAESDVEVQSVAPVEPEQTPAWEALRDSVRCDLSEEGLAAHELVFESPQVALFSDLVRYAAPSFEPGRPVLEAALDLMARIHREFEYQPGATDVATALPQLLTDRRGVCQDFAHLGVGCLRAFGLPARYVSGYLRTLPPPGGVRLVGADASHAWLSVYCGDEGWVDLDPTNDQPARDGYVTLAWGRDYGDVSPVKGVILGGGAHTIEVAVDVEPLA